MKLRITKYEKILKNLSKEDLNKLVEILKNVPKPEKYLREHYNLSYITAKKFHGHLKDKCKLPLAPVNEPVANGDEHVYYYNFYNRQRLYFYANCRKKTKSQVHALLESLLLRPSDLQTIFRSITGDEAATNKYSLLYTYIVDALCDIEGI